MSLLRKDGPEKSILQYQLILMRAFPFPEYHSSKETESISKDLIDNEFDLLSDEYLKKLQEVRE